MIAINHTLRANSISKAFSLLVIRSMGLILLVTSFARGNLVTNGGFEFYTGSAPKDYFSLALPTAWTGGLFDTLDAPGTADNPSDPGLPVYPGFPATSPAGGNFVQSDSTPGLSLPITQNISGLTAGLNYNLSFYQAAGQELSAPGATTDQWQVSLGASTQYSTLMSVPSGGQYLWNAQNMTFTATSASELLSFVAIGAGGTPPQVFLDGVDLESTVPEPSALLLLAGVGTVIAAGRMGRKVLAKRTATAT
jgi:hypothetical protein